MASKRVRRVEPAVAFVQAVQRKHNAADAVVLLRKVVALLKDAPRARARVRACIKSVEGASHHADRMFSEFVNQHPRAGVPRG